MFNGKACRHRELYGMVLHTSFAHVTASSSKRNIFINNVKDTICQQLKVEVIKLHS